jgi:hypothetical protein
MGTGLGEVEVVAAKSDQEGKRLERDPIRKVGSVRCCEDE